MKSLGFVKPNSSLLLKTMNQLNEVTVKYKRKLFSELKVESSLKAQEVCKAAYKVMKAEMELKEYFIILLLNNSNNVLGYYKLSEGGICGTVVDVRIAFATALKCAATGIILCHNHPSGNPNPSTADRLITRKFKDAGKILDVKVLDHLILCPDDFYYSFADEGVL